MNYKIHAIPNPSGSATQIYPWQPDRYIELDTLDGDPIKITLQVEDTSEATSVASSFTRNFRLPKTFNNDRVFQGSCDVNNITFNPRLPVRAYITIDGYVFSEGQIVLERIINNYKNGLCFYEVSFSSEVGSFIEGMGEKVLSDLNQQSLTHTRNISNIQTSWQATFPFNYGSISATAGLLDGNILYPLIEWGYEYKSDNTIDTSRNSTISEHACNATFFKNNIPYFQQQMKPIVRVDWIMKKIFSEAGYSFTSDTLVGTTSTFFDTSKWRCLYLIQENTNRSRIDVALRSWSYMRDTSNTGAMTLGAEPLIYYLWRLPSTEMTGYWDGSYYAPTGLLNPENGRYKVPQSGSYSFRFSTSGPSVELTYVNTGSLATATFSFTYSIRLFNYTNNTTIHTFPDVGLIKKFDLLPIPGCVYKREAVFPVFTSIPYSGNFSVGDELKLEISMRYSNTTLAAGASICDATFKFNDFYMIVNPTASIENVLQPPFSPKMKQRDFVSSLAKKFRWVFEPTQNPSQINITPWKDWIQNGINVDWTDKLDGYFDFSFEPIFKTRNADIVFSDTTDEDWPTKYYEERQKKTYGEFEYKSLIKSLQGIEEYKTDFAPTQLVTLGYCGTDAIPNNNIRRFAIISVARDSEPFNRTARREPIDPRPRLCYWNGTASYAQISNNNFHITNDAGTAQAFTSRPCVSNFTLWPEINTSGVAVQPGENFDINFDNYEYQQYLGELFSRTGNDAVSVYHEDWLNLYYDRPFQGFNNRRATCRMILRDSDVRGFRFNTKVYINGSWWFITKIKDYEIGRGGSTEVELIQFGYLNASLFGFLNASLGIPDTFIPPPTTTTTSTTTGAPAGMGGGGGGEAPGGGEGEEEFFG